MDTDQTHQPGTWSIGRSIVLELETALSTLTNQRLLSAVVMDEFQMVEAIPKDWLSAWRALWGNAKTYPFALETAARLAGLAEGDDYAGITLAIRELSTERALENLEAQAAVLGLLPDPNLPPAERLQDLAMRQAVAKYEAVGFPVRPGSERHQHLEREIRSGLRIIAGGDLHARFWQLLDRFFYETYQPWRVTRLANMEEMAGRARAALGSQKQAPALDWLPMQSPVLRYPELQTAVKEGRLHVFFWVEPFGLTDTWSLEPGYLAIPFAKAGRLYENFQALSGEVAARASALGDPTRLIILRLIRNFSMVNTEIANFLGISRPTVSVHAKILREAGLIQSRQEGRLVRHEIVPSEVRRLFRDLEDFLDLPEK